jgi:hypothetical protein
MKTILELKFGSHLYGTNTPESDVDMKAIYLPSAREIVLGNYHKTIMKGRKKEKCERNTKDDVDVEIFSLDRFLELLCDGQTVALDILFAPADMYTMIDPNYGWIISEIYKHRHELLNKNVNAFVGYARQQAAKYGVKGSRMDALNRVMALLEQANDYDRLAAWSPAIYQLADESKDLVSLEKTPLIEVVMIPGPNKVDLMPHLHCAGRKIPFQATVKQAKTVYGKILAGYGERAHKAHLAGGKDWKALSHAIRVNGEAKELLETGFITFPRPDKDYLLQVKQGLVPFDEVSEVIEKGLVDLMISQEKSKLRNEPNREWAQDLVAKVYTQIVHDSVEKEFQCCEEGC